MIKFKKYIYFIINIFNLFLKKKNIYNLFFIK